AAYIILALEHPPAFIAAGAVGSMAANAAVAIFALTYATLAQSRGVVLSIGAATLVWFAAAALLQSVEWTPGTALAVTAVVFACTIPLSARYRAAVPSESVKRRGYDLPLRAAAVVSRGHPSPRRWQGGGRGVRACAARACGAVPEISRRALPRGADRRMVVLRRRACHHHRVE